MTPFIRISSLQRWRLELYDDLFVTPRILAKE